MRPVELLGIFLKPQAQFHLRPTSIGQFFGHYAIRGMRHSIGLEVILTETPLADSDNSAGLGIKPRLRFR